MEAATREVRRVFPDTVRRALLAKRKVWGTRGHLKRFFDHSNPRRLTIDKDRVDGAGKEIKGAMKDAAGKVTGDRKLQAEGKVDKPARFRTNLEKRRTPLATRPSGKSIPANLCPGFAPRDLGFREA